ncbi:MAG: hypothetical protein KA795_16800 [Burkholderiaceae bacterium]|nr:hypothetical protein [Burkholderiaceae bacterium]
MNVSGFSQQINLKRRLSDDDANDQPQTVAPAMRANNRSDAVTRLQDMKSLVHDEIFSYLLPDSQITVGNALSRPDDGTPVLRLELPQVNAARQTQAIQTAPRLIPALDALSTEINATEPAFRHRPLIAALDRVARNMHGIPLTETMDALTRVRQMAASLPPQRRRAVERAANVLDPRHLGFSPTFQQLCDHADDVAALPVQHARRHGQLTGINATFTRARIALDAQPPQNFNLDEISQVLSVLLQRGRAASSATLPPDETLAQAIRHALTCVDRWFAEAGQGLNRPAPQKITQELLVAAGNLPPALRQLARLPPDEHCELLESWFSAAQEEELPAMFDILLRGLPSGAERGTALADLANLLPHLPHDAVLARLAELAHHARQLPAQEDPASLLEDLAGSDILAKIPMEQKAQAIQELLTTLDALIQRQLIRPDCVTDFCDTLDDLVLQLPANDQPALSAAIRNARPDTSAGMQTDSSGMNSDAD